MPEATIAAHAVSRSFITGKIRLEVLRDLSLDVFPGELTLIVGPSGSGKSTVLSILSGLLRPESGRVSVMGKDLWSFPESGIDAFRLTNCGFVFQGFNLFPALSALEQVLLPLGYLGEKSGKATARAKEVLEEVGLKGKEHLRPHELSGGEKQRVAIARAIVKRPRLLFADEPTSALDGTNGQIVVELLRRVAREHGATVLGVTHDPRMMKHADRVIHLEDGRIRRDERRVVSPGMENDEYGGASR